MAYVSRCYTVGTKYRIFNAILQIQELEEILIFSFRQMMTTYTLGFVHSVAFPVHTDLWDKQSTLVCHRRKSMTDVCSCLPLTMCKILFSVCNTLFQFSLFFLPKFFFYFSILHMRKSDQPWFAWSPLKFQSSFANCGVIIF